MLAIGHLHSQQIVYRDLKPENVLLGADGNICLADFGLSRRGEKSHYTQALSSPQSGSSGSVRMKLYSVVGTPEYIAPEILLKKGHSFPVDWWALGVLICEMAFGLGKLPFGNSEDQLAMFQRILKEDPVIPFDASTPLRMLIKKMLIKDEIERIDVEKIKKHSFYGSTNWDLLYKKELYPPCHPDVPDDIIDSWRKKKERKAAGMGGEGIWKNFEAFDRKGSAGDTGGGGEGGEGGGGKVVTLDVLKEKSRLFLVPFLLPETSEEERKKLSDQHIHPHATLILQGEHYTGGQGYEDYPYP